MEGLVISLAGCVLGLAFGAILLDVFVSIAPQSIPKIDQAAIDLRVAAAAVTFSLFAGLLIALWPGVSAIQSSLLTGTRSVGAIRPWARFLLVAAQIAVTVGLLTGAGLLLRSLEKLTAADVGFAVENVMVAPLTLGAEKYPTPETRQTFLEELLYRTRQLPGVVAAAVSDSAPPEAATDHMVYTNIRVEGRAVKEEGSGGVIAWRSATPGYFETLGIRIARGRGFEQRDVSGGEPAAIINEALVRRMFPNQEPLGQRIGPGLNGQDWFTVVGVIPDTHDAGASDEPEPRYVLARRAGIAPPLRTAFLTIRSSADAATTLAFVREAIEQADPQLPVSIQTMEQRFSDLVERPRFVTWLLASFAALATLLAAAGLYGVVSYIVAERRRSIGVRIALGATPRRIVGDTVREVACWTAGGAVLGLGFAYGGS